MAKKYDRSVFISYSVKDRPVAERLNAALKSRGIEAFFDKESIRAGQPSNEQLRKGVDRSQHLVVLYSVNANASKWVPAELHRFSLQRGTETSGERRLFCTLLDETAFPVMYEDLQMITMLKEAKLLEKDMKSLTGGALDLWNAYVADLVMQINEDDSSEAIPVALVTMTRAEAEQLNPQATRNQRTGPLEEVIRSFGIKSLMDLKNHYGAERRDWRPFGSDLSVWAILQRVSEMLSEKMETPFRWSEVNFVSEDFEEDKRRVNTGLSGKSVILVDPLSLYSDVVFDRYQLLSKCFDKEETLILVTTPFNLPTPAQQFREVMRKVGTPQFDRFFDPAYPAMPQAICGLGVSDEDDMKRIILSTLIRHEGRTHPARRGSLFINH